MRRREKRGGQEEEEDEVVVVVEGQGGKRIGVSPLRHGSCKR